MKFARHIPFVELLGAELLRFNDGESELALTLRDELCNSWQVGHGGVVMTLLDVAMAQATRAPARPGEEPDRRGVITIEMKTTFMRPATGRITCIGRRLLGTRSYCSCEATAFNAQGDKLAHATGTFKFLKALPADGQRIESPEASD